MKRYETKLAAMAFDAIILANGEAPSSDLALHFLKRSTPLVCCDGAMKHLRALQLEPTVIVGDGDSLSPDDHREYGHLFCADKSTEYNDLTKAFRYCRTQQWRRVLVLGAFGLREDHALANISLIMKHCTDFDIVAMGNYGLFTPIQHSTTFPSYAGQPVSVFSFTPETKITFTGLQYPVTERQFWHFWEGSLNMAASDTFTIEFEKGKLLVYQAFKS